MSSDSHSGNTKYIVLCLGLLIGFVVGFVMLLSSLPINDSASGYNVYADNQTPRQDRNYDFYKYLPGNGSGNRSDQGNAQTPAPLPKTITVAQADQAGIPAAPVTQMVPANAQIAAPSYPQAVQNTGQGNALAVNGQYAEVPANYAAQQQSYFLQVGRYGVHQDAQAMRAQVLMLGLEAFIIARVEADGVTAHRVRVGPYFDQNLLTEAKKRLRRGGIDYEIVRVTG